MPAPENGDIERVAGLDPTLEIGSEAAHVLV
jgi:hypothetical protein